MKTVYLVIVTLATTLISFSQDVAQMSDAEKQFRQEMRPLNTELMEWDMVRGEWMSENLVNMAFNRPMTERTFEDDYTLAELVEFVPNKRKTAIQSVVQKNANSSRTTVTQNQWQLMEQTFGRTGCLPRTGRTYGDPHMKTFDGKSYSFQTVGEFVLSKSNRSSFEVQTRQKASSQSVSLNIGVAMNVAGDRVCIYTNQFPDANIYEPVRVNGNVAYVKASASRLPNGGMIRRTGANDYIVSWPSGEKVKVDLRNSGRFRFMNVNVEVPSCNDNEYFGLLGNANGRANDDLFLNGSGDRLASIGWDDRFFGQQTQVNRERDYARYISRELSTMYRINMITSLFDYGIGQSTSNFTDLTFPRTYMCMSDISQSRRDRARRACERQGIRGDDLRGCVFDVAVVDLKPEPVRPIPNITTGRVIKPVNTSDRVIQGNSGNISKPDNVKPTNNVAKPNQASKPNTGTNTTPTTGDYKTPPNTANKELVKKPQETTAKPVSKPGGGSIFSRPSKPSSGSIYSKPSSPKPRVISRPSVSTPKPRVIKRPSATSRPKPTTISRPRPSVPRPSARGKIKIKG